MVALVLVVAAGYLLFNDSQSDMLRQFRLEALLSQAQAGKGSGEIRTSLTAAACRSPAAPTFSAPAPARPRASSRSGTDALGIANLHDWWLETYADGGLVGFALHLVFFVLLVIALWPIARRDPDPLHALPGQRHGARAAGLDHRRRRVRAAR